MCGFLFACSAEPLDREGFDAARDVMAHRGPDAVGSVFLQQGRVGLGHRRLAILDLSPEANQPMQSGPYWIVHNGEIYNSPELRDELVGKGHSFRTRSDTEVILEGFREWGPQICDRLLGMFAFVIWDDERKKVFCARDHVGQKPLYYYKGQKMVAAASELVSLRKIIAQPLSVRWESVPEFLFYDYIPEPNTWHNEIKALPAGHYAEIECTDLASENRLREYWTFRPDPEPPPITERQALELINGEIEQAVRSHLIADVEIGAFLSGGLDSSSVVAVASSCLEKRLKTFCIGMGNAETNEAPAARETARAFGTEHYEEYEPSRNFRASAEDVLKLFGQPFADYSFVPTRRVAQLARKYVTCVLCGDGGDEVWGGYAHFPTHVRFPPWDWTSWDGIFRSARLRLRGLRKWQNEFYTGHTMVTPEQVMATLSKDFVRHVGDFNVTWYIHKYWDNQLDPFRRMQWIDIKTYLCSDLLVKADRSAMRESVEIRSPFLSPRLIEKVLNLPTEVKNPGGELKSLFKKWAVGKVPDEVIRRRKRGFGIPPGEFPPVDTETFQLRRCVAAGIVSKEIVPAIARFPFASWKFEQIEAMLDSPPNC